MIAESARIPAVGSNGLLELSGECSREDFLKELKLWGFTDEGWIDEKGSFWPCDMHMKHGFVASQILDTKTDDDAEKEADRRGWLRLSDYGDRTAAKALSRRQLNTLWDYCAHHGSDYEKTLEGIQYL